MMVATFEASAWGGFGHRSIAELAERNLTPEAKANIEKYTKGTPLADYSVWMDIVRKVEPAAAYHTRGWHASIVDENCKTSQEIRNKHREGRDAVTGILEFEKMFKEREKMSDSAVMFAIKSIVHMVGDMHCPCHMDYSKDFREAHGYKKNSIMVKGKKYDYHKFWDAAPSLMHPNWNLYKFHKECDTYSPKEIKKIVKGGVYKWSVENAKREVIMFDFWERHQELTKMSKEEKKRINDLMHTQLAYGGYRLAATLNMLFAK